MSEFKKALLCYRQTLHIDPRLGAVAEAMAHLGQGMMDSESSGEFLVVIGQKG